MSVSLERYAELVKRLLDVKAGEALHDVSPELVFAVIAESEASEQKLLMGVKLWAVFLSLGASVGNFSTFTFNVGLSGALSVVKGILNLSAAGVNLNLAMVAAASVTGFGGTTFASFRDTRAAGQPNTLAQTRQGAQLASPIQMVLPPNLIVPIDWVMSSVYRTELVVETTVANQAASLALWGYERAAATDEQDSTVR